MNNQNKENQNQNSDKNKEKDNVKNIVNPTGQADADNPENQPKEGGIRGGNEPAKGGRHGNASVEDGGNVEGSSAGGH
jgi:hypothetical protein